MRAAILAFLVAGLASFLVWSYLKRFEEEASGGPRVAVLTVLRTLEPGAVLKDGDIGERGIPQAYVDSRMIRVSDRQRIANLRVATALDAQQALTWSDIVSSSDDRLPSSRVQSPMRLVTIHTEGRTAALVRGGDRVDVIATLPQPGNSEARTGIVLIQNALVLGRTSGDATTTNASCNNDGTDVALSLTLQQAQQLAVASEKAKLTLALRAIIDMKRQEGLQEFNSGSLVDEAKRPQGAPPKQGPVPVGGKK